MAREKNTNIQAQNAPQFLAWHVTEKGEKPYWNKVGAAWLHKDGKGYTLQLETCPINGASSCGCRWKMPLKQKAKGALKCPFIPRGLAYGPDGRRVL